MEAVFIDALVDSLKLFGVVIVATYIIAWIEPSFSKKVKLNGWLAPLVGAGVSLLPQCGFSVVATDLFQKRHITLGCLITVYLTTSDEALPVFLSYPDKALDILPILALKLVIGLLFGYLIDIIYKKGRLEVQHHLSHCEDDYNIKLMHTDGAEAVKKDRFTPCNCDACTKSECKHFPQNTSQQDDAISDHANCLNPTDISNNSTLCDNTSDLSDCCENCDAHQHIDRDQGILAYYPELHQKQLEKNKKTKRFWLDPFFHPVEIFLYALVINFIFGTVFHFVGEETIISFLQTNKYIAPLFAVIVGIIPNCASSIILSELYIFGGLGLGATLGGLCMNAGVALTFLFKKKANLKRSFVVLGLMFSISVFVAYIFSLIFHFDVLHL